MLLVVRVVAAGGQRQAFDRFKINLAEDRIGFVLVVVAFEHTLALGAERAGRRARQQGAQRRLERRIGTSAERIGVILEILAEQQVRIDADLFVEVETADQEIQRAIERRCHPQFLREGLDAGLVFVVANEISAGEIRVLIGIGLDAAIGGDAGQRERV